MLIIILLVALVLMFIVEAVLMYRSHYMQNRKIYFVTLTISVGTIIFWFITPLMHIYGFFMAYILMIFGYVVGVITTKIKERNNAISDW